ncbi:MAG: class I SAM-dependent methyltransferase [Nitrospirae bacterium]|nr:class I SAM-dependent methyltransferase [Nitrospirota bacterium]MBI3378537.1 class I SAM-dependent methyltransferase [Nitrospirota bacterium]
MKERDQLDIDRIAFFGRTYAEYMDMFGLDESLLRNGRILDCPAGASSFAAEAHKLGINVTACDILYDLTSGELMEKGKNDLQHVFEKFAEVSHLYTWKYYKNKDEVMALRSRALEIFANDFPVGSKEGQYVQAEMPHLLFSDKTFSLVLSSNFLFLYGDRLDFDFHIACLKELVRVASGEVRIFPLAGLDAKPYPYLNDVLGFLHSERIGFEIKKAPFEFQRGGNLMLKLYADKRCFAK